MTKVQKNVKGVLACDRIHQINFEDRHREWLLSINEVRLLRDNVPMHTAVVSGALMQAHGF